MLRRLFVLLSAFFLFYSCTTTYPPSDTDWRDFENHLVTSFNYYVLKGKVSGTYFADDITKYGEEMEIHIYGEYFDYGDYEPESEYVQDIFFRNLSQDTFYPDVSINARYIDVSGVPFDMSFDSSYEDVEIVTTYMMGDGEMKRVSYTSEDLSIKGNISRIGDDFWNPKVEGELEIRCKDYFDLKITGIECSETIYPIYE